ncbi:PREDICTED: plastid division protein CDP1, chloroplastic-like [Camelina sativa]|uniref:Plastid division protein CDP1, chloroplastic-like n=1 Tax=Camelina sativa TaxID=90675 RepID=A0ABM0YXK4_CAMSA|nr:PREDICTED: plastid division protein CDP1, chloroplastic-like [Camelina sativa]
MPLAYTFPVLPSSSCLLCGISNRGTSFVVDRPELQISGCLVVRSESGEFFGGSGSSLRQFHREGRRRLNAGGGGGVHVVDNAPSRTSSLAASTSTIEIPVTCYQLIGVSDQAEKDEVVKSVINLKKADAEEGYTMEAAVARQDLLMDIRDKLLFEPEYAGNLKEKIAPRSPLRIPWTWLPGALCLLQEVGQEKLVLDIGRAALRNLDSKPYIHDIFLSMALAECAIAKAAFEANKVSQGFEALARAQSFLKSEVTLGKLALLTQIEESLEELAPPCTLDLLGLPRTPENAERRRGAISALRELLRQGLSVEASCQIQDWPCFLSQAIGRLLATEIVGLLPWDDLAITRKNKKSLESHNQRGVIDFSCFYMVLLAHIAVGFSGKQNDTINKAKNICECLITSEGVDLKFEEAFCSFLLKQGSEAEALEKLKQLESNSDSAVRNSILGKESRSTSATTSLEAWLTESVLANFPDTRGCSPSLANFFRAEKKYPENKKMGSPSIINHKTNQRPLSTTQFMNSSQHLYTAVEQLTPSDLQSPVVSAKNIDESGASMPSVQLKRSLGVKQKKIWGDWLSQSSLIGRVSVVALLGCTVFFSLKLIGIRSGRLQSLPIWVSARPHSESDSFLCKRESGNFRRNLGSVNRNGIAGNIKVLLDMLKTNHGEHSDALYLKSSGLSATSLSHSASEVLKRPMVTEDAEELVRQWENTKAEALGPTHQIYSLSEVLDESMLVQWQTLAETAKAKSCYWRFVLLHLEILQAHMFEDGIVGETAEIEALLEEAAELVDESQPKNAKYYSTYKIRYKLKKQEDGSWKFCESDIKIQK